MDSIFFSITLISVIASVSGSLSVFRRASFLVATVAHSALAGVALSLLLSSYGLELDYFVFATLFAILFSAISTLFSKFYNIDTGISISFALSMALAVIFLSISRNVSTKIWAFLFGELYLITEKDIFYLVMTTVIVLLLFGFFYEKILFFLFDPEGAEASGINVKLLDTILVLIIALSVVTVIRSVGAVLAYAIFVAPSAVGKTFARNFKQSILYSSTITFFCLLAGFLISFSIPVSASAISAFIASILYLFAMIRKS
ncbi:MAG: iron chelate uptake ABC transporter family permease subunit [Archaeoglobaceae archaeon]|nr:metal ABC transporter permease [Archaeoglobaceae archaeon]MDW7990316.1 iron chelate uptake ABC transporter family permease subunit [Archaeoglobaceae archaeon]